MFVKIESIKFDDYNRIVYNNEDFAEFFMTVNWLYK